MNMFNSYENTNRRKTSCTADSGVPDIQRVSKLLHSRLGGQGSECHRRVFSSFVRSVAGRIVVDLLVRSFAVVQQRCGWLDEVHHVPKCDADHHAQHEQADQRGHVRQESVADVAGKEHGAKHAAANETADVRSAVRSVSRRQR